MLFTAAVASQGFPAQADGGGGAAVNASPAEGPGRDIREHVRQTWLRRGLGIADGRRAVDAFVVFARQAPRDAQAHAGLARACYWLGLQQSEAGAPQEAQERTYQRGIDAGRKAQELNPQLAAGYYWEAVNIAKHAELSGIVQSASELPTMMRLMDKVDALEPGHFYGGTKRYWGVVIARSPEFLVRLQGQSLDDAERFFKESLKAGPDFLGTKVFWAEVKAKRGDLQGAKELLHEVVGAAESPADPELRAWNAFEQVQARRKLDALGR
jgi:tetratricopeptide (TPR) repeat protein